MQAEIDALNKHMSLITNQNFELSTELQRFLQTDEVVKTKLNRRQTVDEIRHKVDTAIRRSQREVEQRRSPDRAEIAEDRLCYRHGDRSTSGNARRSSAAITATMGSRSSHHHTTQQQQHYSGARGSSPLRSKSPPRR